MKVKFFAFVLGVLCFSCSGGGNSNSNSTAEEEEIIDYSSVAYFRGKVKSMEIKGHEYLGDITVSVDTAGNISEILFGDNKSNKVVCEYDEQGRILKYVANAEARDLPMFAPMFVEPWFRGLLISYYDCDITFTYEGDRLVKYTDAVKGWTETFVYDEAGNLTKTKISDKKGGRFNDSFYKKQEQDGKTYITAGLSFDATNYVYDDQNRLIETNSSNTNIVYSDKNDVEECQKISWDDWGDVSAGAVVKYSYTYDKSGNWTKQIEKASDESVVSEITRTIVYY